MELGRKNEVVLKWVGGRAEGVHKGGERGGDAMKTGQTEHMKIQNKTNETRSKIKVPVQANNNQSQIILRHGYKKTVKDGDQQWII